MLYILMRKQFWKSCTFKSNILFGLFTHSVMQEILNFNPRMSIVDYGARPCFIALLSVANSRNVGTKIVLMWKIYMWMKCIMLSCYSRFEAVNCDSR